MLIPYSVLFPLIISIIVLIFIIPSRLRSVFLLVAGFAIYCASGTAALYILPAVALFAYLISRVLEGAKGQGLKRLILAISVIVLAGMLLCFKFTGLKGFAPIGISFFVLEAISYLVDIYRGKIEAEKNPVYVLLYLCFFPTLTSGPIERGGNLIPQFKKLDKISRGELFDINIICDSAIVIIYGMFVKLVIADRFLQVTDLIFSEYYRFGTVALIIGAGSFGFQLYCDFMGYSHIVLGVAGLFGIRIINNFKAPYLSASVSEFWRRWHISLSSWLKDYVYITLGGNRKGKIRKYINLLITFIVSGLWHGNGISFLIWGGLHGIYVIADNFLMSHGLLKKKTGELSFGSRFLHAARTFIFVDFAWIFFRADSAKMALLYIRQMLTVPDFWILSDTDKLFSLGLNIQEIVILMLALPVLFGMDYVTAKRDLRVDQWLSTQGRAFRVVFTLAILFYTMIFGVYGGTVDPSAFYYMSF
ncbi:MBOAT family O-acyltransferase [Butyrivibrio sp. WCD3002]|uniref:MBOAT family O-acyltransferase n=1 Tax=Butyrivibrio sp. WCD3002 TaxID=1280676 RepID=UPI000415C74F|nr:MBOAT family O-acyltransferase [Butyrivibrio sp. WCD3002]